MNDFLNKFNEENYKKNKDEKKIEKSEVSKIKPPEHEIEIDTTYEKKKIIKYIVIGITVIISFLIIFLIINMFNQVKMKDLVGTNINEAKTWALKNSVELETTYSYTHEYENDIIYNQDIKSGSKIAKGSIIKLEVSKGLDPNEKIIIPDLTVMNIDEIRNWINEYKVTNAYIMQEYNNDIELGKFIKKEFNNSEINDYNYIRKESLVIYISKGLEIYEKNITVPNFIDKSKLEVETWATENKITINYKEVESKTLKGLVTLQSIEAGTKVAKYDSITVTISLGESFIIPDFNFITKEDAQSINPKLTVIIKTKYHSTISYGKLISQSIAKNTKLYEDTTITLIYSEGRPYIDKLVGRTEKELPEYFYNFYLKGANITYTTVYIDSSEEKGTIIYTSKSNEYLNMDSNIEIRVSKGP